MSLPLALAQPEDHLTNGITELWNIAAEGPPRICTYMHASGVVSAPFAC